jgi:hypothetical protein
MLNLTLRLRAVLAITWRVTKRVICISSPLHRRICSKNVSWPQEVLTKKENMQIGKHRRIPTNLKALLNASFSLLMAFLFLTSSAAYPKGFDNSAPNKRISFEGYLQGTEIDVLQGSPPDAIAVEGMIPGLATHLSEFSLHYQVTVSLSDGSAKGTGELVAADGDRVFVSIDGRGEPTNDDTPSINSIVEIDCITGGTGRFAGAKGGFTVRRLIDLATGFTSGTVRGTIVLPHKPH